MKKKHYVYELYNLLGIVEYVGETVNPKLRFDKHIKTKPINPTLCHIKYCIIPTITIINKLIYNRLILILIYSVPSLAIATSLHCFNKLINKSIVCLISSIFK